MASSQVIDIDGLLQPISPEAPAGVDPRSDSAANSLYYRTKDARNAARSAERAAVEIGGPAPDEWDTVAETAITLLSSQGKDLEIAAWLIEALLRQSGFAGLRDGLRLMAGLVGHYWETCFPEIDEDGVEGRVSAVAGLNGAGAVGTLIQPIRLVPLTHGSLAAYSLWNYEQALDLEKVTDSYRRQERIDNGAVTMEQFNQSIAETTPAFFSELVSDIEQALEALAEMDRAFEAVAGVDAPPVSTLRELLQEILGSVRHFAVDKLALARPAAEAVIEETATETVVSTDGSAAIVVQQVRREGYVNREDALADIVKIAAFFRKTEPHSPISYTLEDAVRRARLTLPELLTELAEDPAHIQRILIAAGIKPPEPGSAY
jgi:type VI secretion system protein ImpA